MTEQLRKIITGPAKSLDAKPVAPGQMFPVKDVPGLTRESVARYLGSLSNEARAELIISAILQTKHGRQM